MCKYCHNVQILCVFMSVCLHQVIKTLFTSSLAKESVSLTTHSQYGFVMPKPVEITASFLYCQSEMLTWNSPTMSFDRIIDLPGGRYMRDVLVYISLRSKERSLLSTTDWGCTGPVHSGGHLHGKTVMTLFALLCHSQTDVTYGTVFSSCLNYLLTSSPLHHSFV